MLNNQANRMTWPVDVSLYPCNELMNGTIMKAETEAQQHGFPLTKADLATTATENQIWVPWADQKGIVESLVYKSFLILDKVVIHAHRDWQVIWIRICLFCPWDFGLCTIQGLWQCLIHWCGIAPSISLDSRLIWWQRRWGSGHMTMGLLIWPHTIPFRSCQPDRIVEKAFNQAAESLAWVWHPVWVRHYFKMQDTLQTNAIIQAVSIRGKKIMAPGNSHDFDHQHCRHHVWLEKFVFSICTMLDILVFKVAATTKKHGDDSGKCEAIAGPLVIWSPHANWQLDKGKSIISRSDWLWPSWETAGTCRELGVICLAFR